MDNHLMRSAILGTDNATSPLRDAHALLVEAGITALQLGIVARSEVWPYQMGKTEQEWSLRNHNGSWYHFVFDSWHKEDRSHLRVYVVPEDYSRLYDRGEYLGNLKFNQFRKRFWFYLCEHIAVVV